jgi:hypothetical protein
MTNVWPNFLVIGSGRSGTTTLHHFLLRHPDIFMCPVNEPNFFAAVDGSVALTGSGREWLQRTSLCDAEAYCRSFAGVRGEHAIGEVSPRYLAAAGAAARIAATLPEVKLVAILRQPAERAFSAFVSLRRDGIEPLADLRAAIADEPRRMAAGWGLGCYVEAGRYAMHLEPYFRLFPKDQIRIYLYEDLQTDVEGLFADLFRFLGVAPNPSLGEVPQLNTTGEIKNPILRMVWRHTHGLRARTRRFVPASLRDRAFELLTRAAVKPAFSPELRAEITELSRPDIERLQVLIDRDLSHWL